MLLSNGMIGLILVFLLLWAFLDLRLAVWVSMGIPISLAGAMFLMFVLGETINMISLFAMIMVLGIIVDDAIVIGESIYFHRKLGKPPIRAAVDGAMEVTMPVFAAVITTVVAFVPLLFVEGVMGKFIKVIPTVVICALLVSLVEALIILPAHLNHLPDMNEKPHNPGMIKKFLEFVRTTFNHGLVRFVDKFYRPMLAFLLSWRYVSLAGAIAVLFMTFGLVQGGFIKFVFFPEVDTSFVFARIEFPEGTSIEVTRDAILRMEKALDEMVEETPTESGEPMVVAMQSSIGMQLQTQKKGAKVGEILVEFLDSEERGVHFRDIVRKWEEKLGPVPGAISVAIDGESGGPPGKPIEVWLLGKDIDMLRAASEDLKETLRQYAGVFQIEDDFRPGKREVRARLKPEARSLGLTSGDLARQLRQGFYGAEVLRVQRGRDEVKVWVRYPIEQRRTMADIERVRIRTPRGEEVPLASVADVSVENGYTTINRKDGLRRVSVSADVFSEVTNATDVLAMVQRDFLETLPTKYPGVTSSLEGEKRELVESMSSLFIGFPLAILGIYLIIATLFRSYLQPIVIMITVPFGLIGAVLGHMAMGFSLTIMSMFGMVALAGVVVNDAIVMIEAVNDRLAAGMSLADSIVDGGARRFRAILLTTATTVGGLAPLIVETSMQAQFLIPMAITIAAGVAFATLLTLVVIPCLLFILNDIRRGIYFLRHGRHCTPEHVEPATRRNVSDEDYFEEGNEEGMTAGSSNTSPAT
jgi:multidrug efflux pump subunit AcrB